MILDIERTAAETGTDSDYIWDFAEALYADLLERVTDHPCNEDLERRGIERVVKLSIAWTSSFEVRKSATLEWLKSRATACSLGPAVMGWVPASGFAEKTDICLPKPLDQDWLLVRDIAAGSHSIDVSAGGGCLPSPSHGRSLKFFNPREGLAPIKPALLNSLVNAGVLEVLSGSMEGDTLLSHGQTMGVAAAIHHGASIRDMANALECPPSFCIDLVERGIVPVPLLHNLPYRFWRFRRQDLIQFRALNRRAKDSLSWDPSDCELVPVSEILWRIRPMSPRQRGRSLTKLWSYGWLRLSDAQPTLPLLMVGLPEDVARQVLKPW